MYKTLPPFAAVAGAKRPKMVLCGEAWGTDERSLTLPFVGSSGKELFRMLGEAMPDIEPMLHAAICNDHQYGSAWVRSRDEWFEAAGIALTNVLALQPAGNKVESLCGKKKEVGGNDYVLPAVKTPGHYLRPEYLGELDRLAAELADWKPNLAVALGNTASWALLRATNIGSIRGATAMSNWVGPSVKVLPTYHPAGVLYNWSWRTIVVADLMKASREMKFPEIRRPKRRVFINPTIEEVEGYAAKILFDAERHFRLTGGLLELGADCETAIGQIKMISFAPNKAEAFVVPFIDERKAGRSYWIDQRTEWRAWLAVKRVCECKYIRIVGQNFIYDLQYTCPMTIKLPHTPEDTMMLHHSMYPEMKKGLGFLGSIYTDESSWKLMRTQAPDTEKRDE